MKKSDIEPFFSVDEVKFRANGMKCRLEPGTWEVCQSSKPDGRTASRRNGSVREGEFETKGYFVKEHDRFMRDGEIDLFFVDARGRKIRLDSVDFGLRQKLGRLFGGLFDKFVEAALSFIEIVFCQLLPIMVFALLGVSIACAIYDMNNEKAKLRENGWTEIDVPNDRRVEAETLARERSRNEFGNAEGKYVFHCRKTAGGSFWYKAHAVTNTCGECAK